MFFIITGLIIVPTFFASLVLFLLYTFPVSVIQKRKNDIEANLPFALVHMAAIAGSGAPPRTVFKILSTYKEYGELSKEAEKIDRNIGFFGLDELTALKEVISKTPSPTFKNILQGILTTIQTGGNIRAYLKEEADKALFEYSLKRSKYSQILAVYADLYTALLIAAPLIFVIILSVLNIVGTTVFGLPISVLINLGMLSLVVLNIIFIIFIQFTQPRV